jgi:hypothetical protein
MPIFERLGYHSLHRRSTAHPGPEVPGAKADSSSGPQADEILVEEERVVRDLSGELTLDMAKVSFLPLVPPCQRWGRLTRQDEQFAIYSTANVALIHLTSRLDEMHRVIISLVGERELEAFDRTQERWTRRELEGTSV